MKLLVLLVVFGLAASMPRKGGKGKGGKKEKEDASTIIRCMAENWKEGEAQIQACRDCFKAVDENDAGLAKAKECVAQYLKMENEACATEIAALQSFQDKEKGMAVLQCFDNTLEKGNNERCLDESTSSDVAGKLTDGAMCVLKSWKYGMEYVKNSTKEQGGKRRGRKGGKRMKGKKGKIMRLFTKAHCSIASEGDSSKSDECMKCFGAAVKLDKGKGRKGKKMKPEMLSAMTSCSEQHLGTKYKQCTAMMKDNSADKKETHACYLRVIVSNLVTKCSEGVAEATADSLSTVMDCGKESTIEWVKNNAKPKVAEMVGNFLDEDMDDDDDDVQG